MERVTGWYKRWVNLVIFVIGLILAAGLNINTVVVADALWSDPLLRASVESAIADRLEQGLPDTATPQEVVDQIDALEELNIPIGWATDSDDPRRFGGWSIPGWIITALAATAGAPFWFDLLKKVANLRGSGPEPKKPEPQTG